MKCVRCLQNVHPYQEMVWGDEDGDYGVKRQTMRLASKCPRCHAVIPDEELVATESAAPIAPRPVAPVRRVANTEPTTSTSLLDAARARLSEIEIELAKADELRTEALVLSRMIAAAESADSGVSKLRLAAS